MSIPVPKLCLRLLLLVTIASCASAPPPPPLTEEQVAANRKAWDAAAKVVVSINPSVFSGCRPLGTISRQGGYFAGDIPEDPDNRQLSLLQLKAGQLGGNAALSLPNAEPEEVRRLRAELVRTQNTSLIWQINAITWVIGEAYICPEPAAAPANQP